MQQFKQIITIDRQMADQINRYLTNEPKSKSECFDEDQTITYTANFQNGVEIDVKLCGVQYREDESNLPWTEAVLFDNGCEQYHSDPQDTFFGTWELKHDGILYVVEVKIQEEKGENL